MITSTGEATSTGPRRFGARLSFRRSNAPRRAPADQWFLVGVTALLGGAAVAYTTLWTTVVRHHSFYWAYAGDLWLTIRTAQWVGWGALSFVYSSQTALVTLPGFPILLTPAVALASALGLSESSPGIYIARPTSLLIILPYCVLLSGTALYAFDRLARCLGVKRPARWVLSIAQAAGIFSATVIWGHPEDVLAAAFLTWAVVATYEGRLVAAGWFLGAAIAMQLYTVLAVPLLVGIVGRRAVAALLARAALLPGCLLAAVLIPNFHGSIKALLDQPNYPKVDHATPWVLLAPNLGHGAVAAGPGRIVAFVVAIGIGFLAVRHRHDLGFLAWLAAVTLAGRCLFESVIDPYYVMPAIAFAIVVAATRRLPRFLVALLAAGGLTVMTYSHPDKWAYWFEMTGLFAAMLFAGSPKAPTEVAAPLEVAEDDWGAPEDLPVEGPPVETPRPTEPAYGV